MRTRNAAHSAHIHTEHSPELTRHIALAAAGASSSCAGAPAVTAAAAARMVGACTASGSRPCLRRAKGCIQWGSGWRHPTAHDRGTSGAEQVCTDRWQGGSQRRTGLVRSPGRPCAAVPPTAARTAGLLLNCNAIAMATRAATISAMRMHDAGLQGWGRLSGKRRQRV